MTGRPIGGRVVTLLPTGGGIAKGPLRGVTVSISGILLLAAAALGQNPLPSGNLYGTALDPEGKSVPGATVTLRGPGAPLTASTDLNGDFRFLYLSPGAYSLTLERTGFETTRQDVDVTLGKNAVLTIRLPIAGAAEAVTVSGEAPVVDSRTTKTGATFSEKELQSIPTTRDPWAIVRQVPGVLVRNMNVGGDESAILSQFVGKGSHWDQNTYNLDGVSITNSGGGTALFFDFDSLQDVEVATGGSDPALATPGVSLNLVTKRGTNELKGSARALYSEAGWDYGLEAGGPIWKDHLWLWGAGARNQFLGQTFVNSAGEPLRQKPRLEHWNAKLNGQPAPANTFTLFYLHFDRFFEAGADFGNRSEETVWNTTRPHAVYKVEDAHVFSEKLFASVYFSQLNGDVTVRPNGGMDKQAIYDAGGVWRNSYLSYHQRETQSQAGLTASGFFDTGNLRHELKFGFGYRHMNTDSLSAWPGDGLVGLEDSQLVAITREARAKFENNYADAYVGDTIVTGNLTVNVGARFDYRQARNRPSAVQANPIFPDLLPAVDYSGDAGYPITRRLVQPRVGTTYALGRDRKTLLRASYSRFVDQLGATSVYEINAFPGVAYLYYGWQDTNGDHRVERDEVDLSELLDFLNVDPNNTGSTASVNRIARNLKPPTTDEFIVGIEREILTDTSASFAYTYRSARNRLFRPLAGTSAADYQYLGNATATARDDSTGFVLDFDEPYYGLTTDDPPAGYELRNRPDSRETYNGFELQLVKRLAHRWMLRASFAYNDWRQHVGQGGIVDPNNLVGGTNASGAAAEGVSCPPVCPRAPVFINSKWQFNVSGMVQLPYGIEASANFFGRQGYILPYWVEVFTRDSRFSRPQLQIGDVAAYRLPDVYQLDLHVEKPLHIGSKVTANLLLDCFNVANSHTVLRRVSRVGRFDSGRDPPFAQDSNFNAPVEVLGDRTFRGGVRISF